MRALDPFVGIGVNSRNDSLYDGSSPTGKKQRYEYNKMQPPKDFYMCDGWSRPTGKEDAFYFILYDDGFVMDKFGESYSEVRFIFSIF